ncbi:MAG: RidA family protein [Rhodospirillales bacterium]|nr:RidA family protein [Rhodospirillales bacterium]
MPGKIDSRLAELDIRLPDANPPVANYVPYVKTGNLVFVSGQVPMMDGAAQYVGKIGDGLSVEDGYAAARICATNLLAHLRQACVGDLDRVRRVVKLGGFVNCSPDFTDIPAVINGASDLLVDVFGDAGRHARFAVGTAALPLGVSVEVDGIFEIE